MATPIDVPQDGNPIDGDNPFSERPPNVPAAERICVRGIYVMAAPGGPAEQPRRHQATQRRTQQQERQVFVRLQHREYYQKNPPRCWYCVLLVPFLLAIAALLVSLLTFVIQNETVKEHCFNVTCMLSCGKSSQMDCWIVIGAGAGVCLFACMYTMSLLLRMCYKTKWHYGCVVVELLVLLVLLGGAILIASFISIGVESVDGGGDSCFNSTLNWCEDVQSSEVFDFLRQSEFSAWISSGAFICTFGVWILMALSYIPKASRIIDEHHPLIPEDIN